MLHSHIPWVIGQGNWPHGTVWLNEAAAETYIPLLNALNRLEKDGIRSGVTIGITPILAEQLAHPHFKAEFDAYLTMKIEAARDDREWFKKSGEAHYFYLARYWEDFYRRIRESFHEDYNGDLTGGFKSLQDRGAIEIITSCATHGYLPLLSEDAAVRAQVQLGSEVYRRHFGRDPDGIWLPECAYRPAYSWVSPTDPNGVAMPRKGIESFLAETGVNYFIIDTAMLKGGKPAGVYLARFEGLKRLWEQFEASAVQRPVVSELTPYRPYLVGDDQSLPVAVLTRDPLTGLQVWSGKHGYPGDGNYLEFHKKRFPGGHRYWRITRSGSDIGEKEPYHPDWVAGRLNENADHFVGLIGRILAENNTLGTPSPLICAPYDTELFGHWWFEGVDWLELVWRKLHALGIDTVTGSEALERAGALERVSLPEGSWGEGGFHQIWFNPDTEWAWRLIHPAEKAMTVLAKRYANEDRSLIRELLAALGRELLLLEASDWPFVISTGSAPDYAAKRLNGHHQIFSELKKLLDRAAADGLGEPDMLRWNEIRAAQEGLFPEARGELWAVE